MVVEVGVAVDSAGAVEEEGQGEVGIVEDRSGVRSFAPLPPLGSQKKKSYEVVYEKSRRRTSKGRRVGGVEWSVAGNERRGGKETKAKARLVLAEPSTFITSEKIFANVFAELVGPSG